MLTVLIEPWRADPLAWIHRAEARVIADELRATGRRVTLETYDPSRLPRDSRPLLRLSDAVMLEATRTLTDAGIAYRGPGADALARCYDKFAATQLVSALGLDVPRSALASDAHDLPRPLVIKPRRGSDSIGLRILDHGPLPARFRSAAWLAQERLFGTEITIAMIGKQIGAPLSIALPEGTPYSVLRKYVLRPGHAPLVDAALSARVQRETSQIAERLEVDWAVRMDFIYVRSERRLCFLECDAAPTVGPRSAFAASLRVAGVERLAQLYALLGESA